MKKSQLLSQDQYSLIREYYHFLQGQRYSEQTIKVYGTMMVEFLLFHKSADLSTIDHRRVELFCAHVIVRKGFSISYHRQFIGAMKLFIQFFKLENIKAEFLIRPKKSQTLPIVLSQEEVLSILQKTRNLKHKMILALIYSAGLRISELINMRLTDINIERKQIRIFQAKGRKDRYVVLPESIGPLLNNYLLAFDPKVYVIESIYGGLYAATSVRKVLQKSCQRAGIKKRVTPHTLRHSYATHLLENGVDIRYIQELLGHQKTETTMIYTHVQRKDLMRIKSPLDLMIERGITGTMDGLAGTLENK